MMTRAPQALCLALSLLLAAPAGAECYADYKAKRDAPLRLQYGVALLPPDACDKQSAARALRPRLAERGWKLLSVVSIFGADGLSQRQDSAGASGTSFDVLDLRR